MSTTETPEAEQKRLALEAFCREVGTAIAPAMPKGVAFTLIINDLGSEGSMAYISTSEREDMTRALQELIDNVLAPSVEGFEPDAVKLARVRDELWHPGDPNNEWNADTLEAIAEIVGRRP